LFIKTKNIPLQKEIDSLNIFKSNFATWTNEISIERNVHCIIYLTISMLAISFLISGIITHYKKKKESNTIIKSKRHF